MATGMQPTAPKSPETERAPKSSMSLGLLVVAGAIIVSVISNNIPGIIDSVRNSLEGNQNPTPTPTQTTTRTPNSPSISKR